MWDGELVYMDKELRELWLEALRSGKYAQGRSVLYHNDTNRYCCLGVLCKVANVDFDDEEINFETEWIKDIMSTFDAEQRGIPDELYFGEGTLADYLADMNDSDNSFETIAAEIERLTAPIDD